MYIYNHHRSSSVAGEAARRVSGLTRITPLPSVSGYNVGAALNTSSLCSSHVCSSGHVRRA